MYQSFRPMQASKDILWTFTMLTEKLLFRRGLKTHVFSSEMFVLLVRIQREMAAPTAKSIDVVIDRKKASFSLLFLVIAHTIKCILHDGSNRSKS